MNWLVISITLLYAAGSPHLHDALRAQPIDGHQLAKIESDLRKRQTAMRSVKYVAEGTMLVPKGSHNAVLELYGKKPDGPVPAEDYAQPLQITYVLDFENNRMRKDVRDESFLVMEAIFYPRYKAWLFDGESLQAYEPRDENTSSAYTPLTYQPDLNLHPASKWGFMVTPLDEPFLLAHGKLRDIPQTQKFTRLMQTGLDRRGVHALSSGIHLGRQCLVLRTRPTRPNSDTYCEYWLDPARDSAAVRFLFYSHGAPVKDVQVEYQETMHGWLPSAYTILDLKDGELQGQVDMRVVEFTPDPDVDDADFRITPQPGMIVDDVAANYKYRVGEPGEPDVDVHTLIAQEGAPAGGYKWWLIGASILACAAIYLFLRQRRMRIHRRVET